MSLSFCIGKKKAAKELLDEYHYKDVVPNTVQLAVTAHESGKFFEETGRCVAAAWFSIPAARWKEDVFELSRLVRSPDCDLQLTRLISEALDKCETKGLDLIVSYADPEQGHHGGIYQAASWNYHGKRSSRLTGFLIDGEFTHARALNHEYGTTSVSKLRELIPDSTVEPKHAEGKYLYWKATTRDGERKAERLELQSNEYPKPDEN